jgi:hypothetical protein
MRARIKDTAAGYELGTASAQKIGFWGAVPIARPAGAAQAAVPTTASTSSTPFGFSQAQADGLVATVNALRTALIAAGLIKGAA